MYITPLSTLISSLSLNHHLYADNSTLFLLPSTWLWLKHYSPSKCSTADLFLDDCQSLNSQLLKTEFLLLGLSKQLAKIHNSSLITTHSARNLGFIFDEHLSFSDQISTLSQSCYYYIHQLRCIRPYLDFETASTTATSIVHSKLDYCNSLYCNLHKFQITHFHRFRILLHVLLSRPLSSVTSPLSYTPFTDSK